MVICTVFSVGPRLAAELAETPAGFEQAIATYPGLSAELEGGLRVGDLEEMQARYGVDLSAESLPGFFANDALPASVRLEIARETGALDGTSVAEAVLGSGSNGLTFVWVPQIFETLPLGRVLTGVFFLALAFAALSSLIAMIELAARVLIDGGMARSRAVLLAGGLGFILGVPSALSMNVFDNQDFVWGVGLMLSGFFFAFAVVRYGVTRFRREFINTESSDIRVGGWWDVLIYAVMLQAVVLMGWWVYQAADLTDLAATFTPLSPFNVGTLVVQWGLAIAVFLGLNRWLARHSG
jgi:hypothetical protein